MNKVSIILLWWTRTPQLEEFCIACLESILKNTDYPNYEVIIIHNKSDEYEGGYIQKISNPKVRVVHNDTNVGFVVGNNQGIALADEHVLLLNNDTVVPKGWLSPLMETVAKEPKLGMVMPLQIHKGSKEYIESGNDVDKVIKDSEAHIASRTKLQYGKLTSGNWLPLCATIITRQLINAIGLLDEKFLMGGNEDVDYSWRAIDAGFDLHVCSSSHIFHYYGQSFHFLGGYSEVWVETGKYLLSKHNATQTVDNAVYRLKDKSIEWAHKNKDRMKPADYDLYLLEHERAQSNDT